MSVIDREKVLAVLFKRFPRAPLCDIAEAANALVGLGPEYELVAPSAVRTFDCDAADGSYNVSHLARGDVRIYRRIRAKPVSIGT